MTGRNVTYFEIYLSDSHVKWSGCSLNLRNFINDTDVLKNSRGNLTSRQLTRAGKLIGPVGQVLDNVFLRKVGESYFSHKKSTRPASTNLVAEMVKFYKPRNLITWQGQREHPSFKNFKLVMDFSKPESAKRLLVKHSMDCHKAVALELEIPNDGYRIKPTKPQPAGQLDRTLEELLIMQSNDAPDDDELN